MNSIIIQTILPFILSALVVIIIMYIAEKYGTKTGGIIGTLPSTIVVAFIFITINKGVDFASESAAVVPAELGINLIFLFCFAILVQRSTIIAFVVSIITWSILSFILYFVNLSNIFISLLIFFVSLLFTFFILEKIIKIPSKSNVKVHYTALKIAFRGLLAGIVIAIAVYLSNINSVLSGIFSVFPAILSSTMLISVKEHGPNFTSGLAKSMIIGISSVLTYATMIHFLYPIYGLLYGSIIAYIVAAVLTINLLILRKKIR